LKRTAGKIWARRSIFRIAQLLKFSMFLLVPYFMLLAAVWGTAKSPEERQIEKMKVWLPADSLQLKNLVIIFAIGYALIYPFMPCSPRNYPVERQVAIPSFDGLVSPGSGIRRNARQSDGRDGGK
jgi:hypothetical protein